MKLTLITTVIIQVVGVVLLLLLERYATKCSNPCILQPAEVWQLSDVMRHHLSSPYSPSPGITQRLRTKQCPSTNSDPTILEQKRLQWKSTDTGGVSRYPSTAHPKKRSNSTAVQTTSTPPPKASKKASSSSSMASQIKPLAGATKSPCSTR